MATKYSDSETSKLTDRQLVARIAASRDEDAFREIVCRYGSLVLGVCRRVLGDLHEAEDAFQATFLVLARDGRKIRRRKCLASWLHGVAYRISFRAATRRSRRMELLDHDRAEETPALFEEIARRHDEHLVDEELHRLPAKERESLTLRYLQELSNDEIAQTLEISVSAVEGRLKRAKERLRRRLMRRGISLGAFLAVTANSRVEVHAVEQLLPRTVELVYSPTGNGAPEGSVAGELASMEIGELMNTFTNPKTLAAVTLLSVGLGLYGMSKCVVGQESPEKIVVQGTADQPPVLDIEVVPADVRSAIPADGQENGPAGEGYPFSTRLRKAQEISAALDNEILVEFSDAPLSEIIDYLSTVVKIPIVLDADTLDDMGLGPDPPMSVNVHGISLRSALVLLLEPVGLDYIIRNEVLMITSADKAAQHLDPRFYKCPDSDLDQVIALITNMVAPETWREVGGTGAIEPFGSHGVVIAQTDQVHDQIGDFLEKLNAATK